MSSLAKALCSAEAHIGLSPPAVPIMQSLGCGPALAVLAAIE